MKVKALKPLTTKKLAKHERERKVLLKLVEYYILTGKPVGSNTLKDADFEDLSSATIRNYFANLEERGYLKQQHISGGRIPTDLAYKLYAEEYKNEEQVDKKAQEQIHQLRKSESKEISLFLQQVAELFSSLTNTAVFLSTPKFDQDFILNLKLVEIDHSRCLAIIITDFGTIQSEVLHVEKRLSVLSIKRIESYFHWRLTGLDKPENLSSEEEHLAQKFYNELMVRYIVSYAKVNEKVIYRTGFSKLLNYPELHEIGLLTNSLALFENTQAMHLLLKECQKTDKHKFWIGQDLSAYSEGTNECTVLAIPYYINKSSAGAIGLLGPERIPYRQLFGIMRMISECISETLTNMVYKFKINLRTTSDESGKNEQKLLKASQMILLEDKTVED